MRKTSWTIGTLLVASAAAAQANEVKALTADCERALALSGAPAHLRDGAGFYLLGEEGFMMARAAENGFVCMVVRPTPQSLMPQCFDEIGQKSHVPVHSDEMRMMMAGMSQQEITAARAEGFANGTYQRATGPGIVYMASDYNFLVNWEGQPQVKIHPHVMYHAPDVAREAVGVDDEAAARNLGLPVIASAGPLGYMVSFIEHATDKSDAEAQCAGQLHDPSDFMAVPQRAG